MYVRWFHLFFYIFAVLHPDLTQLIDNNRISSGIPMQRPGFRFRTGDHKRRGGWPGIYACLVDRIHIYIQTPTYIWAFNLIANPFSTPSAYHLHCKYFWIRDFADASHINDFFGLIFSCFTHLGEYYRNVQDVGKKMCTSMEKGLK